MPVMLAQVNGGESPRTERDTLDVFRIAAFGLVGLTISNAPVAAQPITCVRPPPGAGWTENACYIYVRPQMIVGGNHVSDRGGFFLREEADGAWRQVPMFFSEGAEAENVDALAHQDQTFGPRW